MSASVGQIKTRVLIISDTHNVKPVPENPSEATDSDDEVRLPSNIHDHTTGYREPLPTADVALHCGDLTMRSFTAQFKATFKMLRAIPAPLKLVIAGNHDLMLDDDFYERHKRPDVRYDRAEMWRIVKEAEVDGVKYLTEGTYTFDLQNGARLTVYASPYTPAFGIWAFQYSEVHRFNIPRHVDIAMTHGPPKHVMDWCKDGTRAGCTQLLEAVRLAKPRVHCFGHIHESWGATLAKWREDSKPGDDADEAMEQAATKVVLKGSGRGDAQIVDASGQVVSDERMAELVAQRGVAVDTTKGEHALKTGDHTLFVNAAIMDQGYRPSQLPWLIDIDLDRTPAS